VSGIRLPDIQRMGGQLRTIGEAYATIELSDGITAPQTIELPESRWGELEIVPVE